MTSSPKQPNEHRLGLSHDRLDRAAMAVAAWRAGGFEAGALPAEAGLPIEIIAHLDAGSRHLVACDMASALMSVERADVRGPPYPSFDSPDWDEAARPMVLDIVRAADGDTLASVMRTTDDRDYAIRIMLRHHRLNEMPSPAVLVLSAGLIALDLCHAAFRLGPGRVLGVSINANGSTPAGDEIGQEARTRLAAFRWDGLGIDAIVKRIWG